MFDDISHEDDAKVLSQHGGKHEVGRQQNLRVVFDSRKKLVVSIGEHWSTSLAGVAEKLVAKQADEPVRDKWNRSTVVLDVFDEFRLSRFFVKDLERPLDEDVEYELVFLDVGKLTDLRSRLSHASHQEYEEASDDSTLVGDVEKGKVASFVEPLCQFDVQLFRVFFRHGLLAVNLEYVFVWETVGQLLDESTHGEFENLLFFVFVEAFEVDEVVDQLRHSRHLAV